MAITGNTAEVSAGGTIFKASIQMIENAKIGDYILLHAGFAIQRISEKEAVETLRLFEEMNNNTDE